MCSAVIKSGKADTRRAPRSCPDRRSDRRGGNAL